MRCAFCQNGDISTDKDNGEEMDPRTLAAMASALRREGSTTSIGWAARSSRPWSQRGRISGRLSVRE